MFVGTAPQPVLHRLTPNPFPKELYMSDRHTPNRSNGETTDRFGQKPWQKPPRATEPKKRQASRYLREPGPVASSVAFHGR